MDGATKTELDALKTATKNVSHKVAEAAGKFIENKSSNKIVKPKPENSRNYKEIIIPSEQRKKYYETIQLSKCL